MRFSRRFARVALASIAGAIAVAACTHASSHDAPAPPATASATTAISPASAAPGRTPATPMSYLGADWLDRPDREDTEQPEKVLDALAIPAGATVADVGAGSGYFSVRIARRVGPSGRVIATDIQPQMLDLLRDRAKAAHVTNVDPVLCTENDAKLPAGAVDLALMVDVYHELAHPSDTLAQVRRALRPPGGRLALVEYRGEDPAVAIKPEHKMTLDQIRAELAASAFHVVAIHEFLPTQRIVVASPF